MKRASMVKWSSKQVYLVERVGEESKKRCLVSDIKSTTSHSHIDCRETHGKERN